MNPQVVVQHARGAAAQRRLDRRAGLGLILPKVRHGTPIRAQDQRLPDDQVAEIPDPPGFGQAKLEDQRHLILQRQRVRGRCARLYHWRCAGVGKRHLGGAQRRLSSGAAR